MEKEIIIVYGPPNSGKTAWALSQMTDQDILVDLDRLQAACITSPVYTLSDTGFEIAGILKNAAIDWLARREGSWSKAYVIGGYPKRGPRSGLQRKLKAVMKFMDTDLDTCLSRDPKNSHYPDCIYEWFDQYEPGSYNRCDPVCQHFYDSAEWKRIRKQVLELDHHECQVCRAKGLYTHATIVHHVKHLEDHWELRNQIYDGEGRQLISVCAECHNALHPERNAKTEEAGQALTDEWW